MRAAFRSAIKERSFLIPLIIGGLLVVALLILGATHNRVSELQVPVRYSSFGITNFYREQWFYQFAFLVFGLMVYLFHTLVSLKLYERKDPRFATAFQWLTVTILVITFVTVAAIFQVAELV